MSTPEQPDTPQLTRRQLREIRNTGTTPVVTPEDLEKAIAEPAAPEQSEPAPAPAPTPVSAPLARPADPLPVVEAPVADASVDLGVSPLTRRQARQQERIRTASVPVITPDVAAAHAPASDAQAADAPVQAPIEIPSWWPVTEQTDAEAAAAEADLIAEAETDRDETTGVEDLFAPLGAAAASSAEADVETEAKTLPEPESADDAGPAADQRPILNPKFGADLLSGDSQTEQLPPSFDQLITRSTTGSVATSNALIMSQPSGPSPIVAPVTATGDVLVTGTLNLPEGLGSTGHVPGAADGKEVDSVLVDGELPAHSSPTPIAASAAVSTVKTTGDVIRPPAPEKGSKLMISLAITAGVLALALVGVLIVAIVTGVFQ